MDKTREVRNRLFPGERKAFWKVKINKRVAGAYYKYRFLGLI